MTIHHLSEPLCRVLGALTCLLFLTLPPICHGTETDDSGISLTLEAAIEMALKSNRSFLNAVKGIQSQQLDVQSAQTDFNVKWAPNAQAGITDENKRLGGGVALEKRFTSGVEARILPTIGWDEEDYNSQVGITLDVPLLRGFGKTVNLDASLGAQFSLASAQRSLHTRQVNLVIATVNAVYDIVKQLKLVAVSEHTTNRLQGHVGTARIREKAGLSTPMDVYRAEIRLKDAQDRLTTNGKSLKDAKDRLKLILALPLGTELEVEAPVYFNPLDMDTNAAVQTAIDNRVEIEDAREFISESRRKTDIARHNVRPQLDLVLNYNRAGSDENFEDTMEFDEERWGINLVSTTDWARTREKAAYAKSRIDLQAAKRDFHTQVDEITREVRKQIDLLINAEERIQIREDQVRQGEGKLALAQVKYTYNMANNFDVIEAETELQQARINLLDNQIDHILGLYKLKAVMGTLVERPL